MEWMILPLRRYAQFSGRARRKEFWMWLLFLVVVSVVLSIFDRLLGLSAVPVATAPGQFGAGQAAAGLAPVRGGVLTGIFSLAIFVPNLAVQVRRLHDTNRRGWWLLLPVAPYLVGFGVLIAGVASAFRPGQPSPRAPIGLFGFGGLCIVIGVICAILVFVWFCLDGTRGPNRFGDDPKRPADLGEVFR